MKEKSLLQKAADYCAYQERTQQEVRIFLRKKGVDYDTAEEIISELITQNFLNEERFARAFSGGKFRVKGWGKLKIRNELAQRGVSERNIATGVLEVSDTDYKQKLIILLQKKLDLLRPREANFIQLKGKLIRYGFSKGYEGDLVYETVNKLLSNSLQEDSDEPL